MMLIKRLKVVGLIGLITIMQFFSVKAMAKASLFLTEEVLFLDSNKKVVSVDVINRGTKTGVFAVRWFDHEMQANGTLKRLETGEPEHTLVPFVRFSPRRVTLKPGQSQRIKIALNRNAHQAPAKEYYSHLNVITLNDDLEATLSQQGSETSAESLEIKARIGISIPVIWRHNISDAIATARILSIEESDVTFSIDKSGDSSIRAYLHIINSKTNAPITTPYPVVMYPNIKERHLVIRGIGELSDDVNVILSRSNQASIAKNDIVTEVSLDVEKN